MATILRSETSRFKRALAVNSSAAAYAVPGDTATSPESANGVIDLLADVDGAPLNVLMKFVGVGNNDDTGKCRVWGVTKYRDAAGNETWSYTLLYDFAFTLSAAVGVANGVVPATERYADTITRTVGQDGVTDVITSPTGDIPGHVLFDAKGHRFLYIELARGGAGTPTLNAIYRGV